MATGKAAAHNEPDTCGAPTTRGRSCGNPPGRGTTHEGKGPCRAHEEDRTQHAPVRNVNKRRPVAPEDTAREPWEQQPGESAPAYKAFAHYRDQLQEGAARRSLRGAAAALGTSESLVSRWSFGNEWVKRVEAFDREQDARRLAARARATDAAVERHAQDLSTAAQTLMEPINALRRRIEKLKAAAGEGEDALDGLPLAELIREARLAARTLPQVVTVERLVHGLATERGDVADPKREEAARRVAGMDRAELDEVLLGIDAHDELAVRRAERDAAAAEGA